MTVARSLRISGIVQGVGFRPFIFRQAMRWSLAGWVFNAGDGVHVHIEGDARSLDGFIDELIKRAPVASRIDAMEIAESSSEGLREFLIRESDEGTAHSTLVSPDIATCPACLRELFDPDDRRFHYPFINCTNCGPRFTIIDALPYDRPHTSMAPFTMCSTCEREYRDPADRRFHAQPDACFTCGPTLRLWQAGCEDVGERTAIASERTAITDEHAAIAGERTAITDEHAAIAGERAASDALIEQAASMIKQGAIVAIKGLGGYHLACDATNERAVALLRKRKHRTAKAFALMVRSVADAQVFCRVNARESALLSGTVRPIVLLEKNGRPTSLAPSVTGSLHELGIMLPSTPVQHLLMAAVACPLVMTSGNISEEPIIAREAEAHDLLAGVADAFLDNDRAILSRYDDSVARVIGERICLVRRARGYAPKPLRFPHLLDEQHTSEPHALGILATGPEQKNTFCLVRNDQAFVSQHLGDLENASSFAAWLTTLTLYERLFGLEYQVLVCDQHPEYLSSKWARARGEARIEAQHHHAHIASVLAEYCSQEQDCLSRTDGLGDTVIGIAFDGSGYGDDGVIWGGEVLIANLATFERFAHLRAVPLPGGRAAINHPNRMAWSYLRALGLTHHQGAEALAASLGEDRRLLLNQIIAGHINTPMTTSMGRLFDAASALAGICDESTYEGQAAVEFEAALYDPATGYPVIDPDAHSATERYCFEISDAREQEGTRSQDGAVASAVVDATTGATVDATTGATASATTRAVANAAAGRLIINPQPTLAALLDDVAAFVPPSLIALRFHNAVIALIIKLCKRAQTHYGLSIVALSGGVFMNRYLITHTIALLENEGFTVLLNRDLPANDGGISYGQAAIAAAHLARAKAQGT